MQYTKNVNLHKVPEKTRVKGAGVAKRQSIGPDNTKGPRLTSSQIHEECIKNDLI